ncbi:hypothetical protein COW36_19240 [bacterium (Candidatus Blackallbacteria) CG17_big_fil_post_rev_8_21_14_2_50_48_46]|uniref:Methyltransferase domain-containing protein n=1 Tax=bacterium (Candidatus Blackallbacteria) CG17_big_fil_post_rev_8_21_14_2_50_48_46 TaxID=2014261 RepID=A0A2M7G062_9BACT|nr:MAG: hypothetical protein COW64_25230 [bacterium (Candidatus Blackallbacteria) CG18_big_fil_WC_8_21_14_2_50_49_26]PIW15059.1 MAG: hypothetical protein COW36_19240 [bacterium (Candidatus Blackallbacteria) CG17_big_fil_post_rev_8_21_14_2_50_48_46]PIW47618.1 MAG: hypothetical protein COW20_12080 [bacterium (Candidatus Blackallbacteria) CG13_big_fil_rev_8_21_14_2_50_49_14]
MNSIQSLLIWSHENLNTQKNIADTVEKLHQASLKPELDLKSKGLIHYYLALGYTYLQNYNEAQPQFLAAVNTLYFDDILCNEVLLKFISFAEQLGLLEFTQQLCEAGKSRFPGDHYFETKHTEISNKLKAFHYAEQSNLNHWKEMQEQGYFDHHPHYQAEQGLIDHGNEAEFIQNFCPLNTNMQVAVIGCGYGRESKLIAPLVGKIWGIDVSKPLLERARQNLVSAGIHNFEPVLAEEWQQKVPSGIDLVFSYTVFQHLTKHLVTEYIQGFAEKLAPEGQILCQFMHSPSGTFDAALSTYEPHVSWTPEEIHNLLKLSGLELIHLQTLQVDPVEKIDWIWVHAQKSTQAI